MDSNFACSFICVPGWFMITKYNLKLITGWTHILNRAFHACSQVNGIFRNARNALFYVIGSASNDASKIRRFNGEIVRRSHFLEQQKKPVSIAGLSAVIHESMRLERISLRFMGPLNAGKIDSVGNKSVMIEQLCKIGKWSIINLRVFL